MKVYIVDDNAKINKYTGCFKNAFQFYLKYNIEIGNKQSAIYTITGDEDPKDSFSDIIYSIEQSNLILDLFKDFQVEPGTIFLFTDSQNPQIIQLKKISEAKNIPIEIMVIWNSVKINSTWELSFQKSIFEIASINFYQTNFVLNQFKDFLNAEPSLNKIKKIGLPLNPGHSHWTPYHKTENSIIFPGNQTEEHKKIIEDLIISLPEFKFIICEDISHLYKWDYNSLLENTTMVFSFNTNEQIDPALTIEGPKAMNIPCGPDTETNKEILSNLEYTLYNKTWIENYDNYLLNKDKFIEHINGLMYNYYSYRKDIEAYRFTIDKSITDTTNLKNALKLN